MAIAQRGARAIGTDHHGGLDVAVCIAVGQGDAPGVEIGADQCLAKMEARAGIDGCVDHQAVQAAAGDRPDHLAVVHAVALQGRLAPRRVHHAPAHHHCLGKHAVGLSGGTQRMQAALGQRQVDRAAAASARTSRIGAFFEDIDLKPGLGQQGCHQRAHQPGADDRDGCSLQGAEGKRTRSGT